MIFSWKEDRAVEPDAAKVDEIVDWFAREREAHLSEGRCLELAQLFHPRVIFLKTLRHASRVLDVGAGDGSLPIFKSWPQPVREDLRMYAFSLEKGANFDAYEGYEIGNWEKVRPDFGGMKFDAIFSSHFIEHIRDPLEFISWSAERLSPGGRLYVEWPSDESLGMPSRDELVARGVDIMISNFRDDKTHRELPIAHEVATRMRAAGLEVDLQGKARNPYLEEEVMALFGKNGKDASAVQLAFWSKYRWAQYFVSTRT
ncbi:hypothetical protein GCM10027285_11640 [Oleiagrimonas citrea]|uniref:Class I SAM-dependent methyltransferase n=1 Tax=Oleiagrimonas citrea TaxID=1665687 RepID=A0A846ZJA5_9GAMM|nr:methyltransferase domain-containing protein [Oleiagrimonas citrea]NKZ38274.1 class I SAM-dependent methyltransferase [Oleiagrimonas citrea]